MHSLLLALAALALLALPAVARTVEGVDVPETFTLDGQTLQLNGSALREATILGIDVYVISLYRLKKTRSAAEVLDCTQPLHLAKRFVRDVDASDMIPPWREAVGERGKALGFHVGRSTEAMLRGIPDTREGQTLGFTWRPGKGLEVSVDGRVTARVADPRPGFCKAIFTGYVGEMANAQEVAKALVGG